LFKSAFDISTHRSNGPIWQATATVDTRYEVTCWHPCRFSGSQSGALRVLLDVDRGVQHGLKAQQPNKLRPLDSCYRRDIYMVIESSMRRSSRQQVVIDACHVAIGQRRDACFQLAAHPESRNDAKLYFILHKGGTCT
jgi:hypothetical protein